METLDPRLDTDLNTRLAAARRGDQAEFEALTEPYRGEILSHCYRMLGSLQEAEDLVQETFLRAWRRLGTYAGRGSFRAWLYRIATNACLDVLSGRPKRIPATAYHPAADPGEPMGVPLGDPLWLEPFPDELLAPAHSNPEARFEALESITLAFQYALQALSPQQRAVLILRDVLGWRTREVAELLEISDSAVHSGLYRARTSLSRRYRPGERFTMAQEAVRTEPEGLLEQYVQAWEAADVEALVSLLKEDATFPMPPSPSWYQGRRQIAAFLKATILGGEARGRWKLVAVAANAQPAFAFYRREAAGRYAAYALQVLTVEGGLLADVTTFGMPALFPRFKLSEVVKD